MLAGAVVVLACAVLAPTASATGVAIGPDSNTCTLTSDEPGFQNDTVFSSAVLACGVVNGCATGTLYVCAQHLWRLLNGWIGPCSSTPVTFMIGSQPAFANVTDGCDFGQLYRTRSFAVLFDAHGNPYPTLSDESAPLPGPCDIRIG